MVGSTGVGTLLDARVPAQAWLIAIAYKKRKRNVSQKQRNKALTLAHAQTIGLTLTPPLATARKEAM